MPALTNAQRQKKFRDRTRSMDEDMLARLNMMISVNASAQLKRISKHLGLTQRASLEKLLLEAEDNAVKEMDRESENEYFNVTQ